MRALAYKNRLLFTALAAAILLLSAPSAAFAIIIHTDDTPSDKPSDNVIGQWGTNASCVVISEHEVLTTRHQGGDVGATVNIGGTDYLVSKITNIGDADLRVAVLTTTLGDPISLTDYISLYSTTNETSKTGVLGGFGKARGTTLTTGEQDYGYEWSGSTNDTLRWGQNAIDSTAPAGGTYTSSVIVGDFDGIDEGGYVPYEAAPAEWDSGGGWFIKQSGEWYVAGIIRAVEHTDETWFRNSADPDILDPDLFDAVRVSSYYDDIINAMQPVPEPATLLFLTLGFAFFIKRPKPR